MDDDATEEDATGEVWSGLVSPTVGIKSQLWQISLWLPLCRYKYTPDCGISVGLAGNLS